MNNRTKSNVRWSKQANYNDTATSFHAYYGRERINEQGSYTGEKHKGNSALCNKNFGISEDGDSFIPIEQVETYKLDSAACKRCLKIFEGLPE